jgi:ubiquinol-cytochrome c reductase iron-sulfur subunit
MDREEGTRLSDGSGNQGQGARRRALILAIASFLVALAAAGAFLVFYWTDRGTAALGASLALALAGLGAGLVIWAHGLMPDEEVSGEREPLPSSDQERQAFQEDFTMGENRIGRRKVLGWMAGGVAGLLTLGSLSLLRSLGKSPLPVLFETNWRNGVRLMTFDGEPVPASLEHGTVLTVFPEGSIGATASQTLLLRIDEKKLDLPAGRDGWTPKGFIAFSKICTHAGCPVAQFEDAENLLLCPCHQSTFDILRGAEPIGGPASRPLAQLPLFVDEQGYLRAQGDFSHPPGPGFWSHP